MSPVSADARERFRARLEAYRLRHPAKIKPGMLALWGTWMGAAWDVAQDAGGREAYLEEGPLAAPARRARPARARFPRACGLALVVLALAACGEGEPDPAAKAPPARPSIVLVSLDTLRADHMGLYGYARDTTPALDRLGRESQVFERALSPAAWTLIAHMTMLTGLYPNQHGVVAGEWALSQRTPLLAERLRAAGYQTIGLYFEGWIHARHGFDRGFDVFRAHRDLRAAETHLAEELAKVDPARPVFLFLHLFDIHCGPLTKAPGPVYDCPPPYDRMFLPDAPERIPRIEEGRIWKVPGLLDARALEGLVALYDGGIRYVDDRLGQWIEGWKSTGFLANALLVVTADHGEALGQRDGRIDDHGGGYQEGLHVPLIVRWPDGRHAGGRVRSPVHLVDVMPTVLELAGLARDPALPGVSLAAPPAERELYAYSPPSYEILWQWPQKYIHLESAQRLVAVDLDRDPTEVIGGPLTAEDFEARRAAFLRALVPGAEPEPVAPAELETLRKLEDLGYAGR
jgi:arylsulfatase A-like enzyme